MVIKPHINQKYRLRLSLRLKVSAKLWPLTTYDFPPNLLTAPQFHYPRLHGPTIWHCPVRHIYTATQLPSCKFYCRPGWCSGPHVLSSSSGLSEATLPVLSYGKPHWIISRLDVQGLVFGAGCNATPGWSSADQHRNVPVVDYMEISFPRLQLMR